LCAEALDALAGVRWSGFEHDNHPRAKDWLNSPRSNIWLEAIAESDLIRYGSSLFQIARPAMDARDLKIFEAVARSGGMNSAAAELNTVQSNVTARVRRLEEDLGVALLRRSSRGVTLTKAGERLLPFARKIEAVLADARRAATDEGTPQGLLTIGSLETTAAQRLSPIITAFGTAHPKVNLVIRTGTNAALIEQILDFRLDGAFVCGPVKHPDLATVTAFREELVLATSRDTKSLKAALAGGELKILVKGPGCAYRSRLEDLLSRRGVTPVGRMEFGTIEAILGCVEAGLGVTLLPRGLLQDAERDGRLLLHRLPAAESQVEILFIRRRNAFLFSALQAFMETAIKAVTRAEAAE
jgi:DNA-binding transcriptional LysR family regulator